MRPGRVWFMLTCQEDTVLCAAKVNPLFQNFQRMRTWAGIDIVKLTPSCSYHFVSSAEEDPELKLTIFNFRHAL